MTEPTQKGFRRLHLRWDTGAEFLASCDLVGDDLAFLLAVRPEGVTVGELFNLTFEFADRQLSFDLHATVIELYQDPSVQGMKVCCLPEERSRQELLLDAARGRSVPYTTRRAERIPCFLSVGVVSAAGALFETWALNISFDGMFVCDAAGATLGDTIELRIRFNDHDEPLSVAALVRSVVVAGVQPGAGLEFTYRSDAERAVVRAGVERIRELNLNADSILARIC